MRSGRNRRGKGYDQELKLLAGGVRIHPVAEGLPLIEPSLEAFAGDLDGDGPVVETEQVPGAQ